VRVDASGNNTKLAALQGVLARYAVIVLRYAGPATTAEGVHTILDELGAVSAGSAATVSSTGTVACGTRTGAGTASATVAPLAHARLPGAHTPSMAHLSTRVDRRDEMR
jgi:hypothetical protein